MGGGEIMRPGPKLLDPAIRLYVRRNIGFTPDVAEQIAFAENETGLSASELLGWAWAIARAEILKPVSIDELVYTSQHNT